MKIEPKSHNVIKFLEDGQWIQIERNFHAIGSGSEFALGAMMNGASAETALEIASQLCQHTGSTLDILILEQPKKFLGMF